VKNLATLSTGEVIESPKPLKKNLKKLKRLSRRLSRKKVKSNNRKKAGKRVARLHCRIRNIRKDILAKLTTRLCHESQVVVIEDLNVKGMMRNHKLARAISDWIWRVPKATGI
jgi:putative transposase